MAQIFQRLWILDKVSLKKANVVIYALVKNVLVNAYGLLLQIWKLIENITQWHMQDENKNIRCAAIIRDPTLEKILEM